MTLADIAKSLTEAGQYEQALQIAETIEDNFAKANTLVTIASKYASTGQTDKVKEIISQAVEISRNVEDFNLKTVTLISIIHLYAKTGQYAQALALTKTIADTSTKVKVLTQLASHYAEAGHPVDEQIRKILQ